MWAFAPVQDRHAAPRIAAALRELAAIPEVEVVIVARGGGSLADLFAFCDEGLCRTVALLRVPVIASVGHHTDRTLIDDVAAVSCSTPTHAAEAAVPVDCRAARAELPTRPGACATTASGRSSPGPARSATSRGPRRARQHATAVACTSCCANCAPARDAGSDGDASPADVHTLVLRRTSARAQDSERARRTRELERLALALAAHDPERTMARGYALVADRDGIPLGSAAAARRARELSLRFHDGSVAARVTEEERPSPGPGSRPRIGERRAARTYESAVGRVEEIIRRLDSGEAGLRETLELVREGRELVEYCATELEAVSQGLQELRLEELVTRLEREERR